MECLPALVMPAALHVLQTVLHVPEQLVQLVVSDQKPEFVPNGTAPKVLPASPLKQVSQPYSTIWSWELNHPL